MLILRTPPPLKSTRTSLQAVIKASITLVTGRTIALESRWTREKILVRYVVGAAFIRVVTLLIRVPMALKSFLRPFTTLLTRSLPS